MGKSMLHAERAKENEGKSGASGSGTAGRTERRRKREPQGLELLERARKCLSGRGRDEELGRRGEVGEMCECKRERGMSGWRRQKERERASKRGREAKGARNLGRG